MITTKRLLINKKVFVSRKVMSRLYGSDSLAKTSNYKSKLDVNTELAED